MEKELLFTNEEPNINKTTAWNSCNNFGIEIQPNSLLNPNWENSMDQSDPFESALSSIVSSPVTAPFPNNGGDGVLIRELIGRLGNICNSGEISISSPHSYINSTNTSCYTTPLNSPPKLNSVLGNHPSLAQFPADPGFVDRAARFSFFGGVIHDQMKGNGPSNSIYDNNNNNNNNNAELGDSREGSSLSEQIPAGDFKIKSQNNDSTSNARKRKANPKGKAKENPPPSAIKVIAEKEEEQSSKRSKPEEEEKGSGKTKTGEEEEEIGKQKRDKENSNPKAAEPPKDYIHVRARRGQATDSHSLAERVRREKISERMKFLQDLVPGCNKVTGKAVMLDEIINYVQSLQRQVEFLSMKLATVNPRMETIESRGGSVYPLETCSALGLAYGYQKQQGGGVALPIMSSINIETQFSINSLNAALRRNQSMHLAPLDGSFADAAASQASSFWHDDLQSFVQMGFAQNQQQAFHAGTMDGSNMKVEL